MATDSKISQLISKGIGFIPGIGTLAQIGSFASGMLPENRRAIMENQLGTQGVAVNDIGQIMVAPGGQYNTPEGIMAGYNANKITDETFTGRQKNIGETLKKKYKLDQDQIDGLISGKLTEKDFTDSKYYMKGTDKQTNLITNLINIEKSRKNFADTTGTTDQIIDTRNQNNIPEYEGTVTPAPDLQTPNQDQDRFDGSQDARSQDASSQNQESQENAAYDYAGGGRAGYFFGGRVNYKQGGRIKFNMGGAQFGAANEGEDISPGTDSGGTFRGGGDDNDNDNDNDNNNVPINVSTMTKSIGDYEVPYGLEALLANKGKFQTVLNADDVLNKNLGLDLTYDQGPYQVGFNADMEGNKNLNLNYNKGNLSAYANTDFDNGNLGIKYSFAHGGLASIL